ncbi:DUF5916 domain-containing protein, partial [bacterium]|nr:DUF5916 domain-containing protein [bacterium]
FEDRTDGGYEWQTDLEIGLRPSPGWQIQLEPSYSTEFDPAQYVETVDDAAYTPTFGQRYLFGNLKRQSFSVETRVNVAFSPKLTVQLYAQPLISAGHYLAYKQLTRPRSFDFDVFEEASPIIDGATVSCVGGQICVHDGERHIDFDGDGTTDFSFDDEDFNIRSLKLNAVLRWEYRPGSTLFLVWQHSRRDEENTGAFDLSSNLRSLFATEADNALILKLNYWFDL